MAAKRCRRRLPGHGLATLRVAAALSGVAAAYRVSDTGAVAPGAQLAGHDLGIPAGAPRSRDFERQDAALREMPRRLLAELLLHVLDFASFHYQVASRSSLTAVTIWGLRGPRHVLEHDAEVTGIRFLPLGDRVVTYGPHRDAVVWDAGSGARLRMLRHEGRVDCARTFPSGDRVVTCDSLGGTLIWDAASGDVLHRMMPPGANESGALAASTLLSEVAVFPAGDRVLSWWPLEWAVIWDASTGMAVCELRGHRAAIASGAVFPRGDRVVTGSYDTTAVVWDAGSCEALLRLPTNGWVTDLAVLSDGDRVATLGTDGKPVVWDTRSGQVEHVLVNPALPGWGTAIGMRTFPWDYRLLTYGIDTIAIWDSRTGEVLRRIDNQDPIYEVEIAHGLDTFVVCGRRNITIRDVGSGRKLCHQPSSAAVRSRCSAAIGLGTALDPRGFGRGLSWRHLP